MLALVASVASRQAAAAREDGAVHSRPRAKSTVQARPRPARKVQRQAAAAREEAAVFKTARARLRSIPMAAQAKRILRRDLVFHF